MNSRLTAASAIEWLLKRLRIMISAVWTHFSAAVLNKNNDNIEQRYPLPQVIVLLQIIPYQHVLLLKDGGWIGSLVSPVFATDMEDLYKSSDMSSPPFILGSVTTSRGLSSHLFDKEIKIYTFIRYSTALHPKQKKGEIPVACAEHLEKECWKPWVNLHCLPFQSVTLGLQLNKTQINEARKLVGVLPEIANM